MGGASAQIACESIVEKKNFLLFFFLIDFLLDEVSDAVSRITRRKFVSIR